MGTDSVQAGGSSVAVLRRGFTDSIHVISWIVKAGFLPTDICMWEEVKILELTDAGVCRASLAGKHLEEFKLIFYVGTPGAYPVPQAPPRELWYRNSERTAALLAALSGVSGPRIINRGHALLWGRQLADPLNMLRCLANYGWKTPELETKFSFGNEEIGPTSLSSKSPPCSRRPEPREARRLAVFLRSGSPFMADAPNDPLPAEIRAMTEPTREMLCHLDLDWVTIAVANCEGATHAFGMKAELPRSLPIDIAARIVRSIC